ncbi:hypothetical protein [Mycolicibacterium sp. CR10]|nr:hypothetical protein [Mycolicibacterium sp. CR10]
MNSAPAEQPERLTPVEVPERLTPDDIPDTPVTPSPAPDPGPAHK